MIISEVSATFRAAKFFFTDEFSNKRTLSSLGRMLRTRPRCLAISFRHSATFDERKRFDRKP